MRTEGITDRSKIMIAVLGFVFSLAVLAPSVMELTGEGRPYGPSLSATEESSFS